MTFILNLPKSSYFGVGAIDDSVSVLSQQHLKRAFVVTDNNLVKHGVVEPILALLQKAGVDYVLFDKVTPNPTANLVREGVALYLEKKCDCFIAIGGGSPIDCTKAIRIVAANKGDIVDYDGIGKVNHCGDFFIAINTTSGTSAEMTSNSVITDEERKVKMVIIDSKQIPDIAVNDPTLMVNLPAPITAATGMDALTHAIESYVAVGAHTVTKPTALEAIRLIVKWLPVAVENGHNLAAREELANAQFLAGMSFNSAGLGLVHAMAHQPGATHNLPHGVCNAILLPTICEFNAVTHPERFRDVAKAMGGNVEELNDQEAAAVAVSLIRELSTQVGIPKGFSEFNIKPEDCHAWVEKALADPCLGGNPRQPTAAEIEALYLACL